MPMSPEAFADVLARARGGDNVAMQQLIDQYEPEIRRLAHRRIGPALRPFLESMDLVQSVHRSLMLNLRKDRFVITKPEDLTALAVTFVIRKVSHQWRRIERETQILRLLHLLKASDTAGDDPAVSVERRDEVRHFLEHADDRDRRLLELRLAGRSTAEIATELNLTTNVVRVYWSRLRRQLRAHGIDADGPAANPVESEPGMGAATDPP